jgi:dTDP-4-dehydrorhamnose 3,5-epimerase-like enzyme
MTFEDYMAAIERGEWPEDVRVPAPEPFRNDAGLIQNLAFAQFGSAAFIESHRETVRSNHYHKTDWHFLFVLTGRMIYFWWPLSEKAVHRVDVLAGQAVFTPPMIAHATHFPVHTTMFSLSRNRRDHDTHEADLVRVEPLVRPSW